jgi:hypothetical protein
VSQFATLGPFWTQQEAMIVRALLEGEGIAVVAPEFHQFSSLPHIAFTQGVRLLVPAVDEARARDLLRDAGLGGGD